MGEMVTPVSVQGWSLALNWKGLLSVIRGKCLHVNLEFRIYQR